MKIENLDNCYGCSACRSVCHKNCITMRANIEGFYRPIISKDCIGCGKCEKVCPAININNRNHKDLTGYYGWHKDDIVRKGSSSGGAFSAICEYVQSLGGEIFGAVYDNKRKMVVHTNLKDSNINKIRKSKYVESNVLNTFSEVKVLLEQGKYVLYCGTPCQISGLKSFIGKNDKLITVDFVCHGTPSMKILNEHLEFCEKKYNSKITDVDFRPKTMGWKMSAIRFNTKSKYYLLNGRLDSYLNAFYYNLSLKKACYSCQFASSHESDITLADFWGIDKFNEKIDDDKGISLIITNTQQGEELVKCLDKIMFMEKLARKHYQYALTEINYSLESVKKRDEFYKSTREIGFEKTVIKFIAENSLKTKIEIFIKSSIRRIQNSFR